MKVWFGLTRFFERTLCFILIQYIPGSVKNRKYVNLVRFYIINDSVRSFDNFSDLVCFKFRNNSAG